MAMFVANAASITTPGTGRYEKTSCSPPRRPGKYYAVRSAASSSAGNTGSVRNCIFGSWEACRPHVVGEGHVDVEYGAFDDLLEAAAFAFAGTAASWSALTSSWGVACARAGGDGVEHSGDNSGFDSGGADGSNMQSRRQKRQRRRDSDSKSRTPMRDDGRAERVRAHAVVEEGRGFPDEKSTADDVEKDVRHSATTDLDEVAAAPPQINADNNNKENGRCDITASRQKHDMAHARMDTVEMLDRLPHRVAELVELKLREYQRGNHEVQLQHHVAAIRSLTGRNPFVEEGVTRPSHERDQPSQTEGEALHVSTDVAGHEGRMPSQPSRSKLRQDKSTSLSLPIPYRLKTNAENEKCIIQMVQEWHSEVVPRERQGCAKTWYVAGDHQQKKLREKRKKLYTMIRRRAEADGSDVMHVATEFSMVMLSLGATLTHAEQLSRKVINGGEDIDILSEETLEPMIAEMRRVERERRNERAERERHREKEATVSQKD